MNLNNIYYCGDACGRINDHNDTDLKFAINCGINFKTPENIFYNDPIFYNSSNIIYDPFNIIHNIQSHYKNNSFPSFDFVHNQMIILVGMPGSGKSYFAKSYLETICLTFLSSKCSRNAAEMQYAILLAQTIEVLGMAHGAFAMAYAAYVYLL